MVKDVDNKVLQHYRGGIEIMRLGEQVELVKGSKKDWQKLVDKYNKKLLNSKKRTLIKES